MLAGTAKRGLEAQFEVSSGTPADFKMAAEWPLHEAANTGTSLFSPWWDSLQEEVFGRAPTTTSTGAHLSSATTVSLLNQTLDEMLMSPSAAVSPRHNVAYQDREPRTPPAP